MSLSAQRLFELLPAILRIRDSAQAAVTPGWLDPPDRTLLADLAAKSAPTPAEQAQLRLLRERAMAGPLASLVAVLAEQVAVLQEDVEQLYDDAFIETCAAWVVPYIGDLIGYRALHGVAAKVASPRAEVAHTIAYRRRKGTVSVLEQLARDVTGWDSKAVEFFQHLVMTQYMNHLRPKALAAPNLRDWETVERSGTAFDTICHTVDVRRIASRRGRYNIPNVGIFLWRLSAFPLSRSPAARLDDRRWRFHPLDIDQPLFTNPKTEDAITDLATPLDVPEPISRRVLQARLGSYYGEAGAGFSLRLYENSTGSFQPVDAAHLAICNLADFGGGWAHMPTKAATYVVDPVLGRLALPPGLPAGTRVEVDFHYGFSGELGGGEYERAASFASTASPLPQTIRVPDDQPTIKAALTALAGAGVVEITDSGRYEETLSIAANANARVELRAANEHRPTVMLGGELTLSGGADSEIRINGLMIAGNRLHVPAGNALRALRLSHCTLVPGWTLQPDLTPLSPQQPSLVAELPGLAVTIERSILGGIRTVPDAPVTATDSILDATSSMAIAYAALDGIGAGAPLTLNACTVIGKIHALTLPLVTNTILLADLAAADTWTAPVVAARRQQGCLRFSYVPASARVPRRYQCLPESAPSPDLAVPSFTSLRYGFPAYGQLSVRAGARLLTGADDEGQPGAFHFLYQPQRETNLRVRLDEYLRVGLEAGLFYES
jgi:hypothetical protein